MPEKLIQGQLLIASSRLMDPNFVRTVILLVRYGDDGALGLVLNRPLETSVKEACEKVLETPCNADGNLFQGGPCEGPLTVERALVAAAPDLAPAPLADMACVGFETRLTGVRAAGVPAADLDGGPDDRDAFAGAMGLDGGRFFAIQRFLVRARRCMRCSDYLLDSSAAHIASARTNGFA